MKTSNLDRSARRCALLLFAVAFVSWSWLAAAWPADAATSNRLPVANAGLAQTVEVGDAVVLDGSGSSDADGNALTFHWSFVSVPAGSVAALSDPLAVRPTFQADKPGNYVLELIVNDGQADSAPDAVTISTSNSAPIARAGRDQTVARRQTAMLDGSGSWDPDGDPLSYAWSFVSRPTGSVATLKNPTSVNPSFVVDKSGTYVVQLIVNDRHVDSAPDAVTISTVNSAPLANAGANRTAGVGDMIVLDGSASTDVDGNPLRYAWALTSRPAGSAATLQNPASVRPRFVIDKPGDYVAQLIVNDGKIASEPATVTISTVGSPPVARAGTARRAVVGDAVQLDAGESTDVDGDSLRFLWSILSKPAQSTATLSSPFVVNPTFGIDQPGSYVVQLLIDDGAVASAPDTVVISTSSLPPTARAGANQTVARGAMVQLDGSASSDPNGLVLAYNWSLLAKPSGSFAALSNAHVATPTFIADLAGDYVAQLIVTDTASASVKRKAGKGNTLRSVPDTTLVSTTDSAPFADPGADQNVATASTVQLDGSASFDPDGHALTFDWALTMRPQGSTASLSNSAAVKPTFVADQPGVYIAQLIVSDGLLVSVPETALITASGAQPNHNPQISSAPVTTGQVDVAYSYQVTASDPDGDPLSYTLSVAPVGMTISATGLVGWTPAGAGTVPVTVGVTDGRGGSTSQTFNIVVSAAAVTVPDVTGLTRTAASAAITAAQLSVGTITFEASTTVPDGKVIRESPAAGTAVAQGTAVNLVIAQSVTLPPDPATVAPPLDPTVATTVYASTKFLYSGPNPIQTGADPGTFEPKRTAVLRGRVLDINGAVLSGVTVSILAHAEYGQTLSRADGMFDLVVNGGGPLTIRYQKSGFPIAQRQVNVPWQDFTIAPDVILVAYDPNGNVVSLCAGDPSCTPPPMQVVRGSPMTDASGTRLATLLVPTGTTATMTLADGSVAPLSALTIRATEYTVGPNGPLAMPAELPPTSAYTYEVEFSVDEAEAAGATRIDFSQPLISYTENFLGFPVGGIVPSGDYDRRAGSWIPAPNGRVIQVTGVSAGLAIVDTVGTKGLTSITLSDEELRQLAFLYPIGQQLWRVQIGYFFALR